MAVFTLARSEQFGTHGTYGAGRVVHNSVDWTRAAASRIRPVGTKAVEIARRGLPLEFQWERAVAIRESLGSQILLQRLLRQLARELRKKSAPEGGDMKVAVVTLALCSNALSPAPQRPQTRRALLAKSGIAGLSLAGPLVALPEAANAGRLQDMAAAREAKKSGGKKAAAAPKARRPRQKINCYEDAVAGSMA